jgi:hypothetical protein
MVRDRICKSPLQMPWENTVEALFLGGKPNCKGGDMTSSS